MYRRYWWLEGDTAELNTQSNSRIGGTGTISSLPMTEEDAKAVTKRPIGFTTNIPKKRRRKT